MCASTTRCIRSRRRDLIFRGALKEQTTRPLASRGRVISESPALSPARVTRPRASPCPKARSSPHRPTRCATTSPRPNRWSSRSTAWARPARPWSRSSANTIPRADTPSGWRCGARIGPSTKTIRHALVRPHSKKWPASRAISFSGQPAGRIGNSRPLRSASTNSSPGSGWLAR